MDRSKRIKEMVNASFLLEEVQVDLPIRPTAGFVAIAFSDKMEYTDIQPLHEGFFWIGFLIIEELDGEGKNQ
jgi:hypothetical protein